MTDLILLAATQDEALRANAREIARLDKLVAELRAELNEVCDIATALASASGECQSWTERIIELRLKHCLPMQAPVGFATKEQEP